MLPLFQANVPRGGPLFNRSIHKPRLFNVSPYTMDRISVSLRFWTQEQAIYYARFLMNKNKIFKRQYLDMPSFYSVNSFQNLAQVINDFHGHSLFAIGVAYNPELIKQFY